MLRVLAATGPHPAYADKLMLFGQFVGSWDLDMTAFDADGSSRGFIGEWHFGWVLEGRAVQDVLISRPREDEDARGTLRGGAGSTLRVYDPEMDAWWIVWAGPLDREFSTLFARESGDRIVLDGQWSLAPDRWRFEWSFSAITDTTFRWEGRISEDDGRSWRLVEEMHAHRRRESMQ